MLSCVTGRFQPVHLQHVELFETALACSDHLVIAITNPDPAARHEELSSPERHMQSSNPFTYFERSGLIGDVLHALGVSRQVSVVPFDLTRPAVWGHYVPISANHLVRAYSDWERQKAGRLAEAGYEVTLLTGDPATRIAATTIRASMLADDDRWTALVPQAAVPRLRQLLDHCPMHVRVAADHSPDR